MTTENPHSLSGTKPLKQASPDRPEASVPSHKYPSSVTVIHCRSAQIGGARRPNRSDFCAREEPIPDREMRDRSLETCRVHPPDGYWTRAALGLHMIFAIFVRSDPRRPDGLLSQDAAGRPVGP